MTLADDPTDPLARIGQISDGMRRLKSQVATMRAAWPTGEVFHGEDASGALRLDLSSDGRVSQVTLDPEWQRRIGVRSLARAVNEAIGAASARLGDTWLNTWTEGDAPAADPEAPPRAVNLEEYREAFPPPTTREELRARADAVAAARKARDSSEHHLLDASGRESFSSPSGIFRVTRSGGELTGLESLPNALATMTAASVSREIVAVLAEIDRRASGEAGDAAGRGVADPLRVVRERH